MTSRFAVLTVRPAGKQSLAAAPGSGRWPQPVGRRPAHRTLLVEWPDGRTPDALLDIEPARHHTGRRPGAVGEDALADRARLPRAQARPGPGPLRGPHLARLAPPRHPRHRRPGIPHPRAARPKSPHTGLTLYQVLDAPPGPAEVLDRRLHHLRTPPTHPRKPPDSPEPNEALLGRVSRLLVTGDIEGSVIAHETYDVAFIAGTPHCCFL